MNTLLALLAFSPLLHTPHPTEPPARKRVFMPFEQVFTIVQGGKKVDSIALYLVEPGPFNWKGRQENFTGWKGIAFERGFESREPVATFDRKRFEHAFDEPGIYALAFFRDGQEEWERHFFFFASKWSAPRYGYTLNLTLHKRHPEWEAASPRTFRSTYHDAY